MKKAPKPLATRKRPEPTDSHAVVEEFFDDSMPKVQPLLRKLDRLIRSELKDPQYAVKWQKAYYGNEKLGWVIELAGYHKSVNVVFLAGSKFAAAPPEGEGESRYIKIQHDDEIPEADLKKWIKTALKTPGWK
jgi:hypothetical protein